METSKTDFVPCVCVCVCVMVIEEVDKDNKETFHCTFVHFGGFQP